MKTAKEIAEHLRANNPAIRFGYTDHAVGWFDGQWYPYAVTTITGQWVTVGDTGLPLVNGKPVIAQEQWIEVNGGSHETTL